MKKIDTPIPLKENSLQNVWHFCKESGEQVSRLFKHKVCSVVETKTGNVVSWRGDLDSGDYYFIMVIDGVIYGACHEREMMLVHELATLAYSDEIFNISQIKDDVSRFQELFIAKTTTISVIMKKVNFQEIMNLFMWEYVSDKVEIYDTNIL